MLYKNYSIHIQRSNYRSGYKQGDWEAFISETSYLHPFDSWFFFVESNSPKTTYELARKKIDERTN